jgi:hypothetical protein
VTKRGRDFEIEGSSPKRQKFDTEANTEEGFSDIMNRVFERKPDFPETEVQQATFLHDIATYSGGRIDSK